MKKYIIILLFISIILSWCDTDKGQTMSFKQASSVFYHTSKDIQKIGNILWLDWFKSTNIDLDPDPVPTDVECTFKVELIDDFGSLLILSDRVTFSYPVAESNIASIRGKGTDIVNYMTSTVNTPFSTGYSNIEFNVENNEIEGKEITITMTSAKLGLAYSEEFNLGPGNSRKVQIPLYIADNIDSGRYPIRYSVIDGNDKQVRYNFITVFNKYHSKMCLLSLHTYKLN